jgi:heptaprenyl diphosphate synthase
LWLSAHATTARLPEATLVDLERAAAAIELAHLGSLIHDDIVDDADTRRSVPTLHRTHGMAVAIRTGTALIHLASALTAPFPRLLRQRFGTAVTSACRGQIRECLRLFSPMDQRERLLIMRQKTGALFELAARLGATLADNPLSVRRSLEHVGRRIGVAFQIADDVMDLVGSPLELGRANGADLRDGVMTLPVSLASEAPEVREALRLLRIAPDHDALRSCLHMVVGGGSVRAAMAECARWQRRAAATLETLPPGPGRAGLSSMVTNIGLAALKHRAPSILVTIHPRAPVAAAFAHPWAWRKLWLGPDHDRCDPIVLARLGRTGMHAVWSAESLDQGRRDTDHGANGTDPLAIARRAVRLREEICHPDVLTDHHVQAVIVADCLDVVAFNEAVQLPTSMHLQFAQGVLRDLPTVDPAGPPQPDRVPAPPLGLGMLGL